MTNGYNTPIGVPIGLPSILSLGLPPLINPFPTLNLDFINNPQFDSRITFSRGSQATLFDSTGTLRYAKHNLVTWSQDFSQADWSKNSSTIVSTSVASPITSTNYQKIEATVANTTVGITSIAITAATQQRTVSFFAKPLGDITRVLVVIQGADARINVNLVDGTFTTNVAATGSSVAVAGERFIVSTPTLTGATGVRLFLKRVGETDTNTPTTIAIGEGLYLIGAQMNVSNMEGGVTSSLTTYYPTTTAAYYAPRFDYNPSTLAPRGLLIEEQRTNSILQSEDFATSWTAVSATVSVNSIVAPSGTVTADKLIVDNGISTSSSSIRQEITKAASAITYTLSVFAKKGEANTLRMLPRDTASSANGVDARFNVDNGTVTSVSTAGTFTNASGAIQNVGNGWYRCSVTFTSGTEVSIRNQIFQLNNNSNFTGNGVDGIYIWGYQFETGAFATSYIPTTTTALTRNADVASMTGTNFSSWYNAAAGTLFVTCVNTGTLGANSPRPASMSNGTNNNLIEFFGSTATAMGFQVNNGGAPQANIAQTANSFTANKLAGAYAANDFALSINGAAVGADTSGTVPTVDRLQIGNRQDLARPWNGYIQLLSFYPTRLPNATLQALTL
jgi:hypothetical protein